MTQADAGSSGQSRICRAEAEAAPRQKGMQFIIYIDCVLRHPSNDILLSTSCGKAYNIGNSDFKTPRPGPSFSSNSHRMSHRSGVSARGPRPHVVWVS